MSVYKNEKVEYFIQAVDSLLNQTLRPEQIVLIRDGAVYEELQSTIDTYVNNNPDLFTYLPLEQNGGLGNALRHGLPHCRNELVGRMDTDDISVPDRFEQQVAFMQAHPEIDMVGGNISEFVNDPKQIVSYRVVPQSHEEISRCISGRCPFNHGTVMFKKSMVEKAGSYEGFYLFEDWYLWVRMYLAGATFANMNKVFVNFRISGMADRRGGMKYYRSCVTLLKFMKKNRMIGTGKYLKIRTVRFCGYVLLPNKMREWAYKKFLRKNQITATAPLEEKIAQEV